MKIFYFLVLLLLFLGCEKSEDKTITTLTDNTWIDYTCKVMSYAIDADGIVHNEYYTSIYRFKDSYIDERIAYYSDNKCQLRLDNYGDRNITYYDLGLENTNNSYEVHKIRIEVDAQDKDAYYAISHDKLCFSKSLYSVKDSYTSSDLNGNIYTLYRSDIDIYPHRSDTIDYENCFIKK